MRLWQAILPSALNLLAAAHVRVDSGIAAPVTPVQFVLPGFLSVPGQALNSRLVEELFPPHLREGGLLKNGDPVQRTPVQIGLQVARNLADASGNFSLHVLGRATIASAGRGQHGNLGNRFWVLGSGFWVGTLLAWSDKES